MTVLVTGAAGMIGSCLVRSLLHVGYTVIGVDRKQGTEQQARNLIVDLSDAETLQKIMTEYHVDRVIHLAALAHTAGENDLSWDRYRHVNVTCSENVFRAAGERPVLFISTVDVYGFTKRSVTAETEPHPVTLYGRSKKMAEDACITQCKNYTVFRLSPVYTQDVKRDIQKRYYLKYPKLAYTIGKKTEFEVLAVEKAVCAMTEWCGQAPNNEIRILKDELLLNPQACIESERKSGRAGHVLRIPRWIAVAAYAVLKTITGKNKYTYLLHKAVYPLKTE